MDLSTNSLPDNISYIVNPADENATEEAMLLKDRYGTEVTLISAGPPRVVQALRYCLTMGCDNAIRVYHPALENSDAYITSQLLGWAIAPLKPDLVLCGSRSLDEGTGQVPPSLAEILDLPQVTQVTRLEISPDNGKLLAHRRLEKGNRQVIECNLPALISVETNINRPRYPKLRTIRWAQQEIIPVLEGEAFGARQLDCPTKFVKLSPPRPRPKKTSMIDSNISSEERLRQLMSGGMTEKKSNLWEGTPENLAARLAKEIATLISNS